MNLYQVIARTWRPQRFAEVIGQRHVTETLQNAIRLNRIGHGYIFSGQRGVGKTTVARLLAKALNCQQGPAPEPCGECDSCREIAAGRAVDVIEIDAASNRGIDAVRELRENVRYAPARDRYKIFIIDEAHQITNEGFNALLKTLEEPPSHVVFMLATTEVQEFPETILSRCQHFAFHTVRFPEVMAHLETVCAAEKVEADAEALAALAGSAEGSIRDALSRLEQAIAAFGSRLEGPAVRRLLGTAPSQLVEEVFTALRDQSRATMLEVVSKLLEEGYQLPQFCTQLVLAMRNLLVVRVAGAQPQLLECSQEDSRKLEAWAGQFSEETLMRSLEILIELHRQVRYSLDPRFQMELGLLKLVDAERLVAIEELLARLDTPAPAGAPQPGPAISGPAVATSPAGDKPAASTHLTPLEQDRLRKKQKPDVSAQADELSQKVPTTTETAQASSLPTGESDQQAWAGEILRRLEERSKPLLASLLADVGQWELNDTELTIRLADNGVANVLPEADRQLLAQLVSEVLSRPVKVRLLDPKKSEKALSPTPPTPPKGSSVIADSANGASVEDHVHSDPQVQEFEKLFGKPVTGIRRWKG